MGTGGNPVPKPGGIARKSARFSRPPLRQREVRETAEPYGFEDQMGRTRDPFAMQKVVGSSPIIRS
jgi:hypothetical protein